VSALRERAWKLADALLPEKTHDATRCSVAATVIEAAMRWAVSEERERIAGLATVLASERASAGANAAVHPQLRALFDEGAKALREFAATLRGGTAAAPPREEG
jgi:hypothetical protein